MFEALLISAAALAADDAPLVFERQKLGNIVYEAAAAADLNNDGVTDIVSGGVWFEGPEFTKEHFICDVPFQSEYHDDFGNVPMDINGDGWIDIATGGWFNQSLLWRKNPGADGGPWEVIEVAKVGNIERLSAFDLNGDGIDEIFTTTFPVHFFQLNTDKKGRGTGTFTQHTITMGTGGHGFGAGDIDGDGDIDLVLPGGWLENPGDPFDTENWKWNEEFQLGSASVPIPVYDVNQDGKADLLVGGAHGYGMFWYEQGQAADGSRTWTKHEFDTGRSQFHDVQLIDIDNDGEVEAVTGKRYRAHNGNDPGADDPVGIYYYELNGGDLKRNTIDFGSPKDSSGAGIFFWCEDVDGNGWKDVIAPGKEGVYLFRNQGPAKG